MINENTITVAVDTIGGMADRVMLGRLGIVSNANASIKTWKFTAEDDEDIQGLSYIPTDNITDEMVQRALNILSTDNFKVVLLEDNPIVEDNLIVGRNVYQTSMPEDITIVDVDYIEFNDENLYMIY